MEQAEVSSTMHDIVENGCGYYTNLCFSRAELAEILNLVEAHWLSRLKTVCPNHWQQFSDIGIARYHELLHSIDHAKAWTKNARMLPENAVKKIRTMSVVKILENEYGPLEIVDEENIGYEEIDWRLVRPNEQSDVGPFHADSWFCELGHGVKPPDDVKALKIWIALCCEPGLNGLQVVPHSHKKEWRYHGELRHGFVKPQIDEDEKSLPAILVRTEPGRAILFHDKLLHAGAINRGQFTRVSMEFMIFVKKRRFYDGY